MGEQIDVAWAMPDPTEVDGWADADPTDTGDDDRGEQSR